MNILKKLTAIFLISLFTFNLFGYRLLFYFAQQHSDVAIEKALDQNQYNEKDLITITVPLSLPYQTAWSDFERYDGEINFNGKIYKYVKRKVSEGNLILLCLPDQNKMQLETAKNNVIKNSFDLQNTGTKKSDNAKGAAGKNILNEYNQDITEYNFAFNTLSNNYLFRPHITGLASSLHSTPEQPPELV